MNNEKPADKGGSNKETSHSQEKAEPSSTNPEDPLNKYSFNSYHMNIISGNRNVQGVPPMYQNQSDGMRYYSQPQFFQPTIPSSQADVQGLLNNMFMVLNNQSNLLKYLIDKNDHNFNTTSKIYEQMQITKKQEVEQPDDKGMNYFKKNNFSSEITSNDLIAILYGPKKTFKYSLVVDNKVPFENLLYRERNFSLQINLIDQNKKVCSNSNKIPISLALYTVENPPKFLESNTLGNKMLKGYIEQDLVNGVCTFEKIQIKEVTSHYRKNMLFLVAYAKVPSLNPSQQPGYISYDEIRPLVVDKVVVKAKKMKVRSKQKVEIQSPPDSQQPEKILDADDCE